MRRFLFFALVSFLLCGVSDVVKSQDIIYRGVDTSAMRRDTMRIYYNLKKDADVSLYISFDNGRTFLPRSLKAVRGDVGRKVKKGKNRCIEWNFKVEERDEGVVIPSGSDIHFEVRASMEPLSVDVKKDADNDVMTYTIDGVQFKMVYIANGTYNMGCTDEQGTCDKTEQPVHQVSLTSFFLGETAVTQQLWTLVMGRNPSSVMGSNLPVNNVSFDDAWLFISYLNDITKQRFRLPAEAEWEYAARSIPANRIPTRYSGSDNPDDVMWYGENSGGMLQEVKGKSPNHLGLYDMCGNVFEWCNDRWSDRYSKNAQPPQQEPVSGSKCVVRGGCFRSSLERCRVSARGDYKRGERLEIVGFRLAK